MKAIVEIYMDDGKKVITKESDKRETLIAWLLKMSDNLKPTIGWLEDGTLAILHGEFV